MTMRHTPQNCPNFNAQSRKVYSEWLAKGPQILEKYGIKGVGYAGIPTEHVDIFIVEAPSLEAVQKAIIEPAFYVVTSVDTLEIKPAVNMEEAVKLFQQTQQAAPIPT